MNTPMTLDAARDKIEAVRKCIDGDGLPPDFEDWKAEQIRDLSVAMEALDAAIAARGEAVAWLAADGTGRVIDAKAKDAGSRATATGSATAIYSIPLYTQPPAPQVDAAMVKDAARWRWLREHHDRTHQDWHVRDPFNNAPAIDGLDAAIDAARAAEGDDNV